MASTFRLPAGTSARIAPSGSLVSQLGVGGFSQSRTFSQTSQHLAGARAMNFRPPSQAQPAYKTQTKGLKIADLPNDVGILPGTFIRPLWRDMPSIFTAPRDRWLMEWTWFKSWLNNYGSLINYYKRENSLPMELRKRRTRADALQKGMYEAFANGHIPWIRQHCCDGLAKKLITGIERRPKDQALTWKRLKLLRSPGTNFTGIRVLADRATSIPDFPKSGIRQFVVRITSRQSTTTTQIQKSGAPQTEAPVLDSKKQDCTEYFVIQHLRWNGQDKGWRVWGTTTPTTLETVQNDPHFKPGLSALERIQAIQASMEKR